VAPRRTSQTTRSRDGWVHDVVNAGAVSVVHDVVKDVNVVHDVVKDVADARRDALRRVADAVLGYVSIS